MKRNTMKRTRQDMRKGIETNKMGKRNMDKVKGSGGKRQRTRVWGTENKRQGTKADQRD